MSEPREVVVTLPAIKGLTILEVARAAATAGVALADTEGLLRAMVKPGGDPGSLERGAELLYAWAWQLVKRDEPGVTWAEAQTWRVTFDLDATDPLGDAEAEAVVRAAAVSGLPPEEAGRLTLAELGIYGDLAELRGR
jgi:hypothetical protein